MKNGKKKLQSLFFILWNILGQTEGFLLFCFALQVEGIWNTYNILATGKKKKSQNLLFFIDI